jgi:hypothetical protein
MSLDWLAGSVFDPDSVVLTVYRADEVASLVFRSVGMNCEIRMDRATVYALRNQLPAALAGFDRWDAETAGCVTAVEAQQRAVDAVTRATHLVAAVEQAGDAGLAARLRAAIAESTATASTVDAAVIAFEEATTDADSATNRLLHAIDLAQIQTGPSSASEDELAQPAGSSAR